MANRSSHLDNRPTTHKIEAAKGGSRDQRHLRSGVAHHAAALFPLAAQVALAIYFHEARAGVQIKLMEKINEAEPHGIARQNRPRHVFAAPFA
jgi:hypothetical protein